MFKKSLILIVALFSTLVSAKVTSNELQSMFTDMFSKLQVGKTYVLSVKGEVLKDDQFLCEYNSTLTYKLIEITNGIFKFQTKMTDNAYEDCKSRVAYENVEVQSINDMVANFMFLQEELLNDNGVDISINLSNKTITYTVAGMSEKLEINYGPLNVFQFETFLTEGSEGSSSDGISYSAGKPEYSEF